MCWSYLSLPCLNSWPQKNAPSRLERRSVRDAGRARARSRRGNGPKTDLERKRVIKHRRRRSCRIVVRGDVINTENEAVIHVSSADDVLIDFVRFKVPAC